MCTIKRGYYAMRNNEVKKRGWAKNAAIVFLIILVVLTFFSNTIMNRSLPEVAAQYAESGTITARIRGTGTVSANVNFEVEADQTRRIEEVPVKTGDEVDIGDVLIRLSGDVSDELKAAQDKLHEDELELEKLLLSLSKGDNTIAGLARAVQGARNALSDAQRTLAGISYNEAAYNAALAANNQAQAAANAAEATRIARQYELDVAEAELDALDETVTDPAVYAVAVQKVIDAEKAASLANAAATAANASAAITAATLSAQNREGWLSASSAVRDAQLNLDEANASLTLAQTNESVDSSLESIQLRELRREIEQTRGEIEKLEEGGRGSEITALVSGIVTDINVKPGDTTDPNDTTPLMVIEVVDRGYSLSISVTAQQAGRVNVGDSAEVDRGFFWGSRGEEIRATLIGIRNDPQNPAVGRILHFNITGDVEDGDMLNVTMSQRSENYNVIVPTSALRTDANGDFVLVVMSRNSPLGNRYIATRVDVTTIAADDTHTAVAGGLNAWDFVITTSTAPITPGMQVRLVDNP